MPHSRRKILKAIVRTALVLFGIVVIVSGIFLWRLSTGPVQLNSLVPSIQKAVASLPGGFGIELEGIELYWNRPENAIRLRATRISLLDKGGTRIVETPAVNLSLSVAALMSRRIALSAIELNDVSIHLVRNEDGSLQIGTTSAKAESGVPKPDESGNFHDLTEVIEHALFMLESEPDPHNPLSYLKAIGFTGEFTAEDRKLDIVFRARDIDFSFRSEGKRILTDLSLSITSPEPLSGISIEGSVVAQGDDVDTRLGFSGVQPSSLAGLHPRLEALEGVDLNLNGTVSSSMTLPATVTSLEIDVSGGPGSIAHEQFLPEPLAVRSLELKGNADPADKRMELSWLNLSLGVNDASGPDLIVSGVAESVDGGISVQLETGLRQFEVDQLAVFWPPGLVPGARNWLTGNLTAGVVDTADLTLALTLPTNEHSDVSLGKLEGKLQYSDLSVFFFRPLPSATGIGGTGKFNQHGFDLGIDDGTVEGVKIDSGRVQITGLDVRNPVLKVNTNLVGGAAAALSVLESPPFELDKVIGFDSKQTGGEMTAEFSIAMPLKSNLSPDDIDYQVNASLEQASVRNIYRSYPAENGSIEIYDDLNRLSITGSLDLGTVPITLDWQSNRGDVPETTIRASAEEITAVDIRDLGYPIDQFISGSFGVEVDATIGSGGVIDALIATDIDVESHSIPMLLDGKDAGVKGDMHASLTIVEGGRVSVRDFILDTNMLSARGKGGFEPTSSLLRMELESTRLGDSLLNELSVLHDPRQGTRISVAGGHLDLEPFIASPARQDQGLTNGDTDINTDDASKNTVASGDWQVNVAKLDKLSFSPERYLENVSLDLIYRNAGWHYIRVSGHNPMAAGHSDTTPRGEGSTRLAPGEFSFLFGPISEGAFPLSIEVENLGSLLSATMNTDALSGGYLAVQGSSSGALLTAPVNTSVRLDGFTVIDVPVFARVLNVASLNRPLDSLKTKGLPFESFFGDLVLSENTVSTELLRAIGSTLGVTISGSVDLAQGSLDLEGGVVPLYQISRALEKIPLLKNVLVGDDGKGIIALDFSVVGTADKPDVSVNPGSLLTPGSLRNLLDLNETESEQGD